MLGTTLENAVEIPSHRNLHRTYPEKGYAEQCRASVELLRRILTQQRTERLKDVIEIRRSYLHHWRARYNRMRIL